MVYNVFFWSQMNQSSVLHMDIFHLYNIIKKKRSSLSKNQAWDCAIEKEKKEKDESCEDVVELQYVFINFLWISEQNVA